MSIITRLRSQLVNIKVFRPYFPVFKTLWDGITFPKDYLLGNKSRPFPSIINFNITTRCNLNCEFCFNHDNDVGRKKELSLDQIRQFIKQSAKYRPGFFLTGGEPFSRGDIFEIIDAIKRYDLPVGIVTNGATLNEKKIDRLVKLGVDVMVVSFHGTRTTHDKVVGQKGAWDKTLAALDLLSKKMPSPGPMINYVISENSVGDLRDFLDHVRPMDNIVTRLSHLNFLTPDEIERQKTYWNSRFPDVPLNILAYSYECDAKTFEPINRILKEPKYSDVFTKPILSDNDFYTWYSNDFSLGTRCVFIWKSTFINSNGDVYPCQFLYIKMGNIAKENLENIWNNDLYRKFRGTLKNGLMPGCSRCCKT